VPPKQRKITHLCLTKTGLGILIIAFSGTKITQLLALKEQKDLDLQEEEEEE
jgi:hypothetical protein